MELFNQFENQLFFCFEHAEKSTRLCSDPYCQVANRIVCEKCLQDGPHLLHTTINIYELQESMKQISKKLASYQFGEDISFIKDQIINVFKKIRISLLEELSALETRLQNTFDDISQTYKNASQQIIFLQNLFSPEGINDLLQSPSYHHRDQIKHNIYDTHNMQFVFRLHQKIQQKEEYQHDLINVLPQDIKNAITEDMARLNKLTIKVAESIKNWQFQFLEMLDFNTPLFQGQVDHEFYNECPVCEVTTINDNMFAVGDAKGSIKVYNIATKIREIMIENAHSNFISCLTTLSDSLIVSGSEDKLIKIWNIAQLNNNNEIFISEEQRCFKILSGHQAQVTCIKKINNRLLVSSGIDEKIRVWDYTDGMQIYMLQGHTKPITSLLLYSANENLLSCSGNGIIKAWKLSDRVTIKTIEEFDMQLATLCNIDSVHFACSSFQGTIIIWRYNDWQKILVIEGHDKQKNVFGLIQLNYSTLCSCSYDKSIKLWNWKQANCIGTLYGHNSEVEKVARLNSHNIVSVGFDYKIVVWK